MERQRRERIPTPRITDQAQCLIQRRAGYKAGDFGGERFRNCTDAIKSDGDAIQKFTDLQKSIENGLATTLRIPISIWNKDDWNKKWSPSREKIIGYRNFLTHMGQPKVILVPGAGGSHLPYVLHQDYLNRGVFLTWDEQEMVYKTHPAKWAKLIDVCEELHANSISWLNDAYGEVLKALDRFLVDEDYHYLWGWDTKKHGRRTWPSGAVLGPAPSAPTHSPAGSGISTVFVPGSGSGTP